MSVVHWWWWLYLGVIGLVLAGTYFLNKNLDRSVG